MSLKAPKFAGFPSKNIADKPAPTRLAPFLHPVNNAGPVGAG